MADDDRQQVTFTSGQTGPEAPQQDDQQEGAGNQPASNADGQRPEWLPENFSSPEQMVESYKHLQAELTRVKQGGQSQDNSDDGGQQESSQESQDDQQTGEDDQQEEQQAQLPENLQPFAEEFSEKGELTDESYEKLAEMGYAREVVDAYIKGVTGGVEPLGEDDVKSIKETVGGDEKFSELQQWAGENLSDDELEAYNGAIQNKATARMAVEWLQMKHQNTEGFEPEKQVEAKTQQTPSVKPFKSSAELTRAMADQRYKDGDPEYHEEVRRRLAVSNIL